VETSRRYGFRRHFAIEPWSAYVEVHWSKSGQAYVTPVGEREVGVAVIVRDAHCRMADLLREMPGLEARLAGAEAGPERGAVTTTRRLRRVAVGRVALVGDASGSADAITGEGMGIAFRQALLLADCLADDDVERYNRLHAATLKLPQSMARVLLLMDRFPALRDRAIGMLAANPRLFDRLLGVHVGAEPLGRFLAGQGLNMAWRLAI
jgi:flavin-dependent dehydrogenase